MRSKPFESLKRYVVGLVLGTWAFSAASSSQTLQTTARTDFGRDVLPMIESLATPSPRPARWPRFRGPNGSGVAEVDKPPIQFGPSTKLLWKCALPPGHSSPVVWDDHIFLTGVENEKLVVMAIRRRDGKLLWKQIAPADKLEKVHPFSSPAASTPTTDGQRVYVYFGSYGLLAYDFNGKVVWRKPLPLPPTKYGAATSPIVWDGKVILQLDGNSANSEILAVEGATGAIVWKTARHDLRESWSTPMLWSQGGQEELITVGNDRLVAYSPKDGVERWQAGGLTFQPVTVAGAGAGLLFASTKGTGSPIDSAPRPQWEALIRDYDSNKDGKLALAETPEDVGFIIRKEVPKETPGNFWLLRSFLSMTRDKDGDGVITKEEWDAGMAFAAANEDMVMAVRPGGSGDITKSHVVWKAKRGISEIPSPLFYRDRLYFVRDGGMVTSYEPSTGKIILDRQRLGVLGQYCASPIAADGKIYAASVTGALFFGRIGDLVGRKYTFLVTLVIMGGATTGIGLLPTYATAGWFAPMILIAIRMLQGLAIGGEYGGAAVYVAEHAPDHKRGFYTSFIQISSPLGYFVSLAVILIIQHSLSQESFQNWGWRVPFLLSIFLAAISLYIRVRMKESPIFRELKSAGMTSAKPLKEAFTTWGNLKLVLISLFGATAGQGVIALTAQATSLFYLQTILRVNAQSANKIVAIAVLMMVPLYIVFGALSDRIGRKKLMMSGCFLAALSYFPIYKAMEAAAGNHVVTAQSQKNPVTGAIALTPLRQDASGALVPAPEAPAPNLPMLIFLVFVQLIFLSMVYGPIAAYLVEAFPAKIRYTSLSLPYHIGNGIFGGLQPLIGLSTIAATGNIYAGLWYPVIVAGITFIVGTLLLRETRQVKIWDELAEKRRLEVTENA